MPRDGEFVVNAEHITIVIKPPLSLEEKEQQIKDGIIYAALAAAHRSHNPILARHYWAMIPHLRR